jgi:tRNA pseudouridine13 synthase
LEGNLIVRRILPLLRIVARELPLNGQDEVEAEEVDVEVEETNSFSFVGLEILIYYFTGGGNIGGTPRGTYPPYIHFTLQKTNRDTQDALAHLSRILHVNIKDLSVAGTKDKRGVTVQRVALRRHNKTVEDVWKLANGQAGRKSQDEVLTRRGERGIRIADLNYKKSYLDLGMLKGNAFVITLRYVFQIFISLRV